jgi:hypothetical protein
MKQSRVKRLAFFFSSFFHPTLCSHFTKSCVLAGSAAERDWQFKSSSQYGRRSQAERSGLTRRDLYQAGCLHSYSCSSIADGTSNFIQPKAPILRDAMSPSGLTLTPGQDTFAYPAA